MRNRDRLKAALDFPPRAEPLVVAPAWQDLEIFREKAEVRVDEVLLAPDRRRALHDAVVVDDG